MPRPKSFEEDAVLDRAVELFRARGYEGTSLADLEAHLGLGRQSLYNAFGDKQALFLKALDRYRAGKAQWAATRLGAPDAGLEAIRDFFRAQIGWLTQEEPRGGCLVVNTITERGSDDPEALLRCNGARGALERAFRRALQQAKTRGEVSAALDVETTATLLVIQSYGLNVVAKTGAAAEELSAAVEALLAKLA